MHAYQSILDGGEHVSLVQGHVAGPEPVLVRVHSECLAGDVFGSGCCDCDAQLQVSLAQVAAEGRGVVVYLRGKEGRGSGFGHSLTAVSCQNPGLDRLEANIEHGLLPIPANMASAPRSSPISA